MKIVIVICIIYLTNGQEEVCPTQATTLPFAGIWGEFLIAAFVPMHTASGAFGCSKELRSNETIEVVETLLYAVDVFNNKTGDAGPWQDTPAIAGRLGIIVLDTCQSPLRASWLLSSWISGQLCFQDPHGRVYQPQKVIGIVGPLYSSESIEVAKIADKVNLVQISYSSSVVQLFDYATFLRTIPADDVQAQVMIDLAKQLHADSVSILYRDDSFGIKGYEEVINRAKLAKICIDVAVKVPFNVTQLDRDISSILIKLAGKDGTRFVILFVGWEQAEVILKHASTTFTEKTFVWIGSHSWGSRFNMLNLGPIIAGSFNIDVEKNETTYAERIQKFVKTLKPSSNMRNMYFNESFEHYLQCRLSENSSVSGRMCQDADVLITARDPKAELELKSVWGLALGLSSVISEICGSSVNCAQLRSRTGVMKILEATKLAKVLLEDGTSRRIFTNRGDGNVPEVVLNVQLDDHKQLFYKQIGRFNESLVLTEKALYYNNDNSIIPIPESVCRYCNCSFRNKSDPLVTLNKFIKTPGSMYLVCFVPVHSSIYSNDYSIHGLIEVEALQAMVQYLNEANPNGTFRPRLGLMAFDSYSSWDVTLWHLLGIHGLGNYFELYQYNIQVDLITGFLLNSQGYDTKAVMDTAEKHRIIHINVGTSTEIAQTNTSYYFPMGQSLYVELEALCDVVAHFNWEHIILLHSDSSEGQLAHNIAKDLLKERGVCVTPIEIQVSYPNFAFVGQRLKSYSTKVVFALIDEEQVRPLLDILPSQGYAPDSYPIFIGWRAFTRGLEKRGGTYVSVGNQSIGVMEENAPLGQLAKTIMNRIIQNMDNFGSNPWLDKERSSNIRDILQSNHNETYYNIIDRVVTSVNDLHQALVKFFEKECPGVTKKNEDCLGLHNVQKQVERWRERLRDEFSKKFSKKVTELIVQAYYVTDQQNASQQNAFYTPVQIGKYQPSGKNRFSMTNPNIANLYKSIQSACNCKDCQKTGQIRSMKSSEIVLLVLLLIALVGILAIGIFFLCRKKITQSKAKTQASVYEDSRFFNKDESAKSADVGGSEPPCLGPRPPCMSQTNLQHSTKVEYSPGSLDSDPYQMDLYPLDKVDRNSLGSSVNIVFENPNHS